MKYSFNFLQVTNWLIICRKNMKQIQDKLSKEDSSKEEILKLLEAEKHKITILKGILDRKIRLHGISKDFLQNLKEIKKEYGIPL